MGKICVYTCITGNYDNLKDIKFKEKNIDYICFTNNKNITSNDWTVKYIDEDLDNLTLARKIKILGYKYLSEYDITVWLDGAVEMLMPISTFICECCDFEQYDMICFNHQLRDCIYDEINECVRVNKESVENALTLEKFLLSSNYPKHNGLIESTVLVRKNIMSVNKLMDDWFEMLLNYSRRDQLSFNYVLWKNPINIKFLDIWVFNNKYFLHDHHIGKDTLKKYRLYFGNATKFDFHKCLDGTYTNGELKEGLKIKIPIDTSRIELTLDEVGSYINNVYLNKENTSFIYNACEINGKKYFYDSSIISFDGNFFLNEVLIFKIDVGSNENNLLKEISLKINELYSENMMLLSKNDELSSAVEQKNIEINNILNSKSWKVTKPLRQVRRHMK